MKTRCKNITVRTSCGNKETVIAENGQLMMGKLRAMLNNDAVVITPNALVLELVNNHYTQKKIIRQQAQKIRELETQLKIQQDGIDRLIELT